jgi:hypothetical protein
MCGVGVWPTGVAVGAGDWPSGVGVGVGVCPTGVAVGVGVGAAVDVAEAVATLVGVPLAVADCVTVAEAVGEAVGEAVAVDDPQASKPTWFVSSVTSPFRARALPDTLAPVFREMLVSARILPTNTVPVPIGAELPTRQNTLQSTPPLITSTTELLAVVSVLTVLKMKTALALPSASSVKSPVS